MSLFPYTGPMTSKDIFDQVYRRSAKSLSCRDRMCGADDCETCRGPQEEPEQEEQRDDTDRHHESNEPNR